MRKPRPHLLVTTVLLGLAVGVFAQEQKSPFTPEEGEKLNALEQAMRRAFDLKEHDKALAALKEQEPILAKGMERVRSGEVDYGEQSRQVIRQLGDMLAGNLYNQACCLSILGQAEEAVAALGRSIELGYVDVGHMALDKDLDNIRSLPGYRKLVEGLDYNDVYAVHVPEGLAGPAPTVFALHGQGATEKVHIDLWKGLADRMKFILVAVRGPVTLALDQYAWKRDPDDEEAAVKKILATIQAVKGEYSVDPARVYLLGFKQGGNFATLLALKSPDVIRGSVAWNSYWNKYYYPDFFDGAKAGGAKLCLIHRQDDPFHGKAVDGEKQLAEAGIPAKLIEYGGEKELPDDAEDLVRQALEFLMK